MIEASEKQVDTAAPAAAQQATGEAAHAEHGVLIGKVQHPRARTRRWSDLRAWLAAPGRVWGDRVLSPFGALALGLAVIVGLFGYGLGTSLASSGGQPATSGTSGNTMSGMSGMSGMNTAATATPNNVPNAIQTTGNHLAKYTIDSDGAKHFTFTAQQVMWSPVKGASVLAWTLDGTVPGPMIRATAGDHVRITIINHLPEPTAIHWHGLEVPTDADGVPPLGQKPIKAGETYTYDFTIQDADAGTHWYHSHYDDLRQVGGGLYGAFIVDPRPGSAEARQAIHADVDQTLFFGMLGSYYVINGKSFPDTDPITVTHGQTVRLRLIGADVQMIHPMHLHGHYFTIAAEGGHPLASPIEKDTIEVAPGDTYDVTFYAWAPPGSIYPFHCHILSHLMNPGQSEGEMGGLITLVQYTK
jgi:FtsP/CotA-like multicopper oxidase with cupredoxin domain